MASKKEWRKKLREQQRQSKDEVDIKQKERYEQLKTDQTKNKQKKTKIIVVSVIVVLLLISASFYFVFRPGKYNDFAKCLTQKGAIMYGEDWCQYTTGQKNMFGNSFKYVNYEVKTGLKLRPTWIINNKTYETVQSFEHLAFLTGCEKYLAIWRGKKIYLMFNENKMTEVILWNRLQLL